MGAGAQQEQQQEQPLKPHKGGRSQDVSAAGWLALSTITTGMPNSSGAPMLRDSTTVVGLYTGIVWHLEEIGDPSSSSSSSSTASGRPPSAIERDPKKLWTPPASTAAANAVAAAAGDTDQAAELSRLNIGHKNSMSLFTTASALTNLLQEASVAILDPVHAAAAKSAARRSKRGRS